MRSRSVVAALWIAVSACAPEPISWGPIVYDGVPRQPRDLQRTVRAPAVAGCPGSLRVAESAGSAFAVWWRVRSDSSSALLVSRAMHGGDWLPPVTADSTDRSTRGCGRPPPAISADAQSGYVHIVYFVEAPDGPGVFFAHSMDSGATFHAPVPIVFGKQPARVSMDSRGDVVAVAYEDPNSIQPRIGLSLSRTMGHLFQVRSRATSDHGRARQPVVRLSADSVHLWWSEYSPNPAVSMTRQMYRAGKI